MHPIFLQSLGMDKLEAPAEELDVAEELTAADELKAAVELELWANDGVDTCAVLWGTVGVRWQLSQRQLQKMWQLHASCWLQEQLRLHAFRHLRQGHKHVLS